MSTDYSDIGFSVNSSDDVYNMLANNMDRVTASVQHGKFQYMQLQLDKHSWLYYYGDAEGIDGEYCEPVFLNPHIKNVKTVRWVNADEESPSGLLQIFCDGTDTDFPLNVLIPDAFVFRDEELPDRVDVSITMFAQDMETYESLEAYVETKGPGRCLNGCIPCGTFPLPGKEEDFVPSATAIVSGPVLEAEKLVNDYSGNEYWFIVIDCCGHKFGIVADLELVPDTLKPGNFVSGFFWISGLIMESETN